MIHDYCQIGTVFVHRNLLDRYSSYFKNLIKQSESRTRHHDQLSIELEMNQTACEMLARWLYGHPLCVNNSNANKNLEPLAQLYDSTCDANEEGSSRGNELVDACLECTKQCLAQTSDIVYNPIEDLESLLVKGDEYPGRAVILRELVYGECATDGRTKLCLEQFCGPERGYEYRDRGDGVSGVRKEGLRSEPEQRWHQVDQHS